MRSTNKMSVTAATAVLPVAGMSALRFFLVRDGGASRSARHRNDPAMTAMLAVTAGHFAAIMWLFYQPVSPPPQLPALSFTVTLMDMSASPNSVSTAASAPVPPAEKVEPKKPVIEVKPVARTAKPKQAVKASASQVLTASAPVFHSAQAQAAVVAPIIPAKFAAAYLQNSPPAYPPLSRRLGEQGNVLLGVYVTEQGTAETVAIRKSSGVERLDSAALEAVRRWRFIAARQGDQLIASWVQVPIQFILE